MCCDELLVTYMENIKAYFHLLIEINIIYVLLLMNFALLSTHTSTQIKNNLNFPVVSKPLEMQFKTQVNFMRTFKPVSFFRLIAALKLPESYFTKHFTPNYDSLSV